MKTRLLSVCGLVLMLLAFVPAAAGAVTVTVHQADGTLADGFNRLLGGTAFLVPATGNGSRFLVVNETGQAVKLVPDPATVAIGALPPGHIGLLAVDGRLDLLELGAGGFYLWQGQISDGGAILPPAAARIALTPTAAVFAPVLLGGSGELILTVSNVGGAELILGALAQNDPLTAPFSLPAGSDSCSGSTLAPGTSCTVKVVFTPAEVGTFTDSFDIPSSDSEQPQLSVAVGGSGEAPPVSGGLATDFSTAGLGSGVPAGWTERWVTGAASYTVLDSIDFPGRHELDVVATTGARRLISFDAADALGANVDTLMLFRDPVNEGSIHTDFRLYARAAGSAGNESAYYFTTDNNQQSVGIYKTVNGVLTPISSGDEQIGFNTTDAWWVRFRVEGQNMKVKLWPYGSLEPRDWQLAVVDASIAAAGWQGIGNYWIGNHIFYQFAAAALPESAQPVNGFGVASVPSGAVNLDAEVGDSRGWTNEFGELRVNVEPALARSGAAHFIGGPGNYRAYQRIDLAARGITPEQLAQGVAVSFRAWQRSLSYGDDPGRIGLRVLDAAGNELSISYTPWEGRYATYMARGLVKRLPENAAYVDVILEGQLVKGGAASAYFDDLEVSIAVQQ